jgi:predicted RNase H-like HicB family nuclease
MKFRVIVHEAEEGGYWAEVPAAPGCASQGDTTDDLMANIREAIEGCLSVDIPSDTLEAVRIVEVAV